MSQLAPTRPPARTTPRPAAPRATPRTLRVVPAARPGHAGFFVLCLGLLLGGLVSVLMLNTAIAKGSFVLGDLRDRSAELADTHDALAHAIDAQSASAALAERALGMGMVPSQSAAFLRLDDGRVLGVAKPATKDSGFTVVAQGTPHETARPAQPGEAAAPQQPERTTNTTTKGAVTTTTVTVARAGGLETTTTSVDSRTGQTTTTTTLTPGARARAATPTGTPSAVPSTQPDATPGAAASTSPDPELPTTPAPSASTPTP